MLKIYYTYFDKPLANYNSYFQTLPQATQHKIQSFRRWQDQHSCLLGRLLLRQAISEYNLDLAQLKYDQYQRPYFSTSNIDFNIAHAGSYVLCAIAQNARLGIDIELIRNVELKYFKSVFNHNQLLQLKTAQNMNLFFNLWTQKESIIKADGRGLQLPLANIEVIDQKAYLEQKCWFVHEITNFLPDYACHLAIDQPNANMKWIFLCF